MPYTRRLLIALIFGPLCLGIAVYLHYALKEKRTFDDPLLETEFRSARVIEAFRDDFCTWWDDAGKRDIEIGNNKYANAFVHDMCDDDKGSKQ